MDKERSTASSNNAASVSRTSARKLTPLIDPFSIENPANMTSGSGGAAANAPQAAKKPKAKKGKDTLVPNGA